MLFELVVAVLLASVGRPSIARRHAPLCVRCVGIAAALSSLNNGAPGNASLAAQQSSGTACPAAAAALARSAARSACVACSLVVPCVWLVEHV